MDASSIFVQASSYSSGGYKATSAALADVNGDGKPDLLLANGCVSGANCANGNVAVMLGNGDGTFQAAQTFNSGGQYAVSIVVADVNGDGKPDLLVANECADVNCVTGNIGVLIGNGDGTFQAAQTYSSGAPGAISLAVADVNGDGKPDLLMANQCVSSTNCNGVVGILLGNGDGTFRAAQVYNSGGQQAFSIAVADLNGDGKPDLVVANQCSSTGDCINGSIAILLGSGNGTFQLAQTYNSLEPRSIAVADVNGDGKADLLVANECLSSSECSEGGVEVLLGNGNGSFQPGQTYSSGGQEASSITVGDLNGDGKPDLFVSNLCSNVSCDGSTTVLLGNGDGSFQLPLTYPAQGNNPDALIIGDVNGDGKPDAFVVNECADANCVGGSVTVLLGNGDGTLRTAPTYNSGGQYPFLIAAADVNGDGKTDLVIANNCADVNCVNGSVGVLLGNGDGTFQPARTYNSGGQYATSIAVADVNGDGKPDLVVANECVSSGNCTTGSVAVLLGNGDGTFQAAQSYTSGGDAAVSVVVADINGDGKPDLVVANECMSSAVCTTGSVEILLGNGDGTFQPVQTYNSGGDDPLSLAISDVNGDGKPDLLVANSCATNSSCQNGGVVGVLLGNGDGTFQTAKTYNSGGLYPSSIAVGDLNGDGKADLAVSNSGTAGVLLGNGDGTFQPAKITAVRSMFEVSQIALADFDGDGKLDVVIATGSTLLLGNGDGTFQNPVYLGVGGAGAAVGYFNGDGTPDLAIGGVTILLNTRSGHTGITTGLVSSPNPSTFNQSVMFTATVTPQGAGTPTGTVTFRDGTTPLGVVALTNGTATLRTSSLIIGQHSITAVYSGDANFGTSTSPALAQAVNQASSSVTVSSSVNPAVYGQSFNLSANVTPQFSGTATGTVTFYNGTTALGTASLSANIASLNAVNLGTGSYSITASYSGDSNVRGSSSAAISQTVAKASTTVGLASNVNPSYLKQSVTFTAGAKSQYGGAVVGSITFKQGTATLATVSLTNGQATYTTSYSSVGTRSISAVYSGDSNNLGSTSVSLNQVVTRVPTSTAVTSSLNPSFFGDTVTFSAVVTPSNTNLGLPAPTGTVTFKNGGAVLGTSTLNGSTATYTTNSLAPGNLSITTTYNSDANYTASTSVKLTQTVKRLATTTTPSVNINPSAYGQGIQFTATVAPGAGTGTPTGSVVFKSGTSTLATILLNNGVASYNNSNLAVGTKSITAVYNGDTTYASSTSSVLSQVINKATTTTLLTSSLNPSNFGQSVTFTAAVSPQYSGTPTGSVTFKQGTKILGTVVLSSSVATYTTSTLPKGADQINATYTGSGNFTASTVSIIQNVQ